MLRALDRIDRIIRLIGLIAACLLLPVLAGVRLAEIGLRQMNLPSSLFNAMEGEIFTFFAFLILGAAFVSGAHVRVDILRARWSAQTRARVEIIGALVFALPFVAITIWFGVIGAGLTFSAGERAAFAFGAPLRWMLTGVVPLGIGLLGLAILSRAVRCALFLKGRAPDPDAP